MSSVIVVDPAEVSIKIGGHELGFDDDVTVVTDVEVLPVDHSFAVTIALISMRVVHTHGGYRHKHALLDDGRLGPATHFENTNT